MSFKTEKIDSIFLQSIFHPYNLKSKIKPLNMKTAYIFKELYEQLIKATEFLEYSKNKKGIYFYDLKINKIFNKTQIPKPKQFPYTSIPHEITSFIDENSHFHIQYNFELFQRKFIIHFICQHFSDVSTYNHYIDSILLWFYVLNHFASLNCSKNLIVYLYFTDLKKKLPKKQQQVLDQIHANTAFTRSCTVDSEIVIFREEEWFKVLIHECFHSFGLDFSNMNMDSLNVCHELIKDIFPVNSDIRLYEAYTEFWARILNIVIYSFYKTYTNNVKTAKTTDFNNFLSYTNFSIHQEIIFSCYQMIKVLNHMGLKYEHLYLNEIIYKDKRKTFYKENTSILSYYIIQTIMINHFQDFLSWCLKYNTNILQFNKTENNVISLCNWIEKRYNKDGFLDNIFICEKLFNHLKNKKQNNRSSDLDFILTTMRMTLFH